MEVTDLPVEAITRAVWNPNELPAGLGTRLRRSIERFGFVVPLIVREVGPDVYETVGGAHRLAIVEDMGIDSVPCVIVEVDNADARLLSQCLNRLQGEDNLGLRADLFRKVLEEKPMEEVLALLPDSAESLTALAAIGQDDLAESLRQWQAEQAARLRHLTFQLVPTQLEVVEEALERVGVDGDGGNPNRRGVALYSLCREYLNRNELA